jgi:hypothetical protein
LAILNVTACFHAFRLKAVNDAENPLSLLSFNNHDLNGISSRAVNCTHFWNLFDRVKHVNWERVLEKDNEAVSCSDSERSGDGVLRQSFVGP